MKSYQFMLLATVLVASAFAGYTNTTSFWGTLLTDNDMHFQVYSGIFIFYINQVMKKSIGISQKIQLACFIIYSLLWDINLVLMSHLLMFH
jgi:hypothetical protein